MSLGRRKVEEETYENVVHEQKQRAVGRKKQEQEQGREQEQKSQKNDVGVRSSTINNVKRMQTDLAIDFDVGVFAEQLIHELKIVAELLRKGGKQTNTRDRT